MLPCAVPSPRSWCAVVAFLGCVCGGARAQDVPTWYVISAASPPPGRIGHRVAYDAARDDFIVFAGQNTSSANYRNDTWRYHNGWALVQNGFPLGRVDAGMAYDSLRGRISLWGGQADGGGGLIGWFNWSGAAWVAVPGSNPFGRYGVSLAHDAARDRMVLFGGVVFGTRVAETWEYDSATNTFFDRTPAPGYPAPSPRANASMVYDARRGVMVLFGGQSDTFLESDTWEWDGGAWTQIDAPGPDVREDAAMWWDSSREVVVLAGGGGAGFPTPVDTWEYNGVGWTNVLTAAQPSDRHRPQGAYDPAARRGLLFGGSRPGFVFPTDLWEYVQPNWQSVTGAPIDLTDHAMATDSTRGQLVIFGGQTDGGAFVGDTYVVSDTATVALASVDGPTPRSQAAMADFPSSGGPILFGGADEFDADHSDTWEWDGAQWTELSPATVPPARRNHAMAYDSARDRVVMFGGYDVISGWTSNDTWEWDGNDWTQIFPATSPSAREGHAMAFDPVRGRVLMFGGRDGGTYDFDTWEWDGADWTLLFAGSHDETPFAESAMAWDPARRAMILFGGETSHGGGLSSLIWRLGATGWTVLDSFFPVSSLTMGVLPATQTLYAVGGTFLSGPNGLAVVPGQAPAQLGAHPVDTAAAQGDAACFAVDAYGTEPLAYQWRKDGVDLVDDDRISGATGATLCITGLLPEDVGVYSAVVSNAAGVATTRGAALDVLPPPCPADLTGDGMVGSADLASLLGSWGPGPGPADLNGDEQVNSGDLALLLGSWGACP